MFGGTPPSHLTANPTLLAGARADRKLKDGVKHVVTAYPYDEFVGVNAPTGTPAYLMIETTHAKKIYCAKSQEDRAMWVDSIRKNGERAARAAITRQGSRSISKMTKQSSLFGNLFGGKRVSTGADYLKERDELSAGSMLTMKARPSLARSERSASSSGSGMLAVPEVADEDLDDELQKMVGSLGLKGPQAAAVLNLPREKKREMLKGFTLTQQQDKATPGKENEPRAYATQLLDDPTPRGALGAAETSSSSREVKRGPFSMTVTFAPKRRNICANSSAM